MYNFCIFLKTYKGDFKRANKLIESFNLYNKDNIKLFISVPKQDFGLFESLKNENIELITDESYAGKYFVEKSQGLSVGYINQEICKLSFWESNLAENYLCLDADCLFIRDFYVSDFMADEKVPYTVLVQDKDLLIEKHYWNYGKGRQKFIEKIYAEVGLKDRRYRTCHGMQVLNSTVLKSLKEDFMASKNFEYKDLLEIAPFEFTWYNAWFQKCKKVPEMAVEPFFKTFHMRIEYQLSRLKLLTLDDYSKRYVGIILNGNWKRPETQYINPNKWHKRFYKIINKL